MLWKLDELTKLPTLSRDGATALQEHLVTLIDALYNDELHREGKTAEHFCAEWRKARSKISD